MKSSWIRGTVLFALCAAFAFTFDATAQRKKKEPDASQGASVSQTIGVDTEVTITYHRPGIRGRDVWTGKSDNPQIGPLVPHDGDPRPWRAGANEATTISFSSDVKVEGQPLSAGTYAFFAIPTKGDWTLIFSNKPNQWGSFGYKQEQDVLRVTVSPVEAAHQEWLIYGFDNPEAYSATAFLHWGTKKIPFKIEVEPAE